MWGERSVRQKFSRKGRIMGKQLEREVEYYYDTHPTKGVPFQYVRSWKVGRTGPAPQLIVLQSEPHNASATSLLLYANDS
jgi:hypothetical protein